MFEEQVSSTSSSGYLNFSPGPNKENENKGRKRISDYIYETPNKKRHFQTAGKCVLLSNFVCELRSKVC
jgi:hypothetical protein